MSDPQTLERFRVIVESGTPLAQSTVLHLIERANQANLLEAANIAREQARHLRAPAWAGVGRQHQQTTETQTMNDNDQSRTPLPPAVVSELKEIMEGFKEKFGDSILIQVGKLTEEHVGWGIQFGHDAGLIITDVGPGYEGNVKVGLHGYESWHFVTELHPDKFVTITPKDAA